MEEERECSGKAMANAKDRWQGKGGKRKKKKDKEREKETEKGQEKENEKDNEKEKEKEEEKEQQGAAEGKGEGEGKGKGKRKGTKGNMEKGNDVFVADLASAVVEGDEAEGKDQDQ